MDYEFILQWFEQHPDARPNDLTEDMALFVRAARSGQLATPADFLAKFYILHLKAQGKPLPVKPSDYSVEFVEKASDFFDYVGMRCMYNDLKKDDMVTYEDSDVGLLRSDMSFELHAEPTEKGTKAFEAFQKKIEESYNKYMEAREKAGKAEDKPATEEGADADKAKK